MGGQNRVLAILLGVLALLVLVVGGLSAGLLLTGRGEQGDTTSGTATSGTTDTRPASGRLRLASSDPITLDPHIAGDAASAEYIVEIYSGLMTIDPDLNIVPDLAESYDVSPDGKTYTFRLRDNALFHSGRRVSASDVKWSIERASSRGLQSSVGLAYLGDIVGARDNFFGTAKGVSGVEVVDERTVRFTLDAPKPYFLAKLTYPTAFVVDKEQVESNPRNWTRKPNGTGPYKIREWRVNERLVLDANERFYLGAPKVKEVLYELAGGATLTRFENNELDVSGVGLQDIERARDPSSTLGKLYKSFPEFSISYIAFNVTSPPFDDVNVRRAFALAIDRKRISEVTFNNMLSPATGVLPPQLPGFTPSDKTYQFNPDAAKQALAASRYGSADKLPPIVITEVGAGAEGRVDTQAFLEQWRTILGVRVEIRQTDAASFFADQDAGRLQMFNSGWIMDYPDPEDILDLKFHSGSELNDLNYKNAEVDDLLNRARVERDPQRRIQLYQDAEKKIVEDAVWLPLYFSNAHVVVKAEVKGWFEAPMVIPRLRFVEVTR
ncbi:MAG: peptide ABC transporter substrate-binding protein [Dehalococcoidia bacterium]|nr:peptide ABC transporter substrate-binding protein [Dehalococcoidia bacterium]